MPAGIRTYPHIINVLVSVASQSIFGGCHACCIVFVLLISSGLVCCVFHWAAVLTQHWSAGLRANPRVDTWASSCL